MVFSMKNINKIPSLSHCLCAFALLDTLCGFDGLV